MKNEIAVVNEPIHALAMKDDELLPTLQASVWPGAKLDSVKMALAWCRASHKDPFKRPVHIVPMKVKKPGTKEYEWRDIIMPGINDYRTDAARTGAFAGLSKAEFGPTKLMDVGDGQQMEYPEWCEIVAYRIVQGMKCEFPSGRVRFVETYATQGWDSLQPNAMWRKRPFGQLEKCAEAMALRRGFPEIGGEPTKEEMEGRILNDDSIVEVTATEIKMPTAKKVDKPAAVVETKVTAEQMDADSVPVGADEPIEGTATEKPEPKAEVPQSSSPLASEGAKVFITRKLGQRDPVAFAQEHGVDWNALTVDAFNVLKKALTS